MQKDYYVILTGGKNNAGDYLIKHRAKQLFDAFRQDREIVDFDGWKVFDDERLRTVNGAKALILMGGPALQEKMRPRVYGLTDDLAKIKVPITTMGIGWYSPHGRWEDTHHYPINRLSRELLERVANDGLVSSVRDYHTLNTLFSMGFEKYLMTGCPALYSLEHLDVPVSVDQKPKRIGFSLGVSLKWSRRMESQAQQTILKTGDVFPEGKIEVVFHHGIGHNYLCSDGVSKDLYNAQSRFISWLEKEGIPYVDISGSAENLMDYYSQCDLHIGYRVHAHIFMSSISKPSILLAEDGRGVALRSVIGGVSFNAYKNVYKNKIVTLLHKLRIPFDEMEPAAGFIDDYSNLLRYEYGGGVRLGQTRENINRHFYVMKRFICQLP
jgi:hypothetical protein